MSNFFFKSSEVITDLCWVARDAPVLVITFIIPSRAWLADLNSLFLTISMFRPCPAGDYLMLTASFLMCSCDNVPLEHVNVSPFVKKIPSVWPHSKTYAKKLQEHHKGRFQTLRAHCKHLYTTMKLKISFKQILLSVLIYLCIKEMLPHPHPLTHAKSPTF